MRRRVCQLNLKCLQRTPEHIGFAQGELGRQAIQPGTCWWVEIDLHWLRNPAGFFVMIVLHDIMINALALEFKARPGKVVRSATDEALLDDPLAQPPGPSLHVRRRPYPEYLRNQRINVNVFE